jgi:hypothetical protein
MKKTHNNPVQSRAGRPEMSLRKDWVKEIDSDDLDRLTKSQPIAPRKVRVMPVETKLRGLLLRRKRRGTSKKESQRKSCPKK